MDNEIVSAKLFEFFPELGATVRNHNEGVPQVFEPSLKRGNNSVCAEAAQFFNPYEIAVPVYHS